MNKTHLQFGAKQEDIDDLQKIKEMLELLTPEEQKAVVHSIMTIYSVNHGPAPNDQKAG